MRNNNFGEQRPGSARVRTPQSGRQNTLDHEPKASIRRPQSAVMSSSGGDNLSLNNEGIASGIAQSQSSQSLFRCQSALPRTMMRNTSSSPFETSRFPTVPDVDPPPRPKRPLACPEKWCEINADRNWVITPDVVVTDLDPQQKMELTNKLVIRNKHRLWKLDASFKDDSPLTIATNLHETEDRKFVPLMRSLHYRERVLNLGGSDKLKHVFSDSHLVPVREPGFDPFIVTTNTPRDTRQRKMERMLLPTTVMADKTYRRGYAHTQDYGNFSNFNGILNRNKEAMLDR